MTKTQKKIIHETGKFLHERPKGANERNFYRSLFAIIMLIVATAALLNHVGLSSANSRSNDLVRMAVEAAELR